MRVRTPALVQNKIEPILWFRFKQQILGKCFAETNWDFWIAERLKHLELEEKSPVIGYWENKVVIFGYWVKFSIIQE